MRPGPIQARYTSGQVVEMRWNVYADHGGWFEYRICLDGSDTEDCFRRNILLNTAGQRKNWVTHMSTTEYVTHVKIPDDLTCDRCTLSWYWHGSWDPLPRLEDNIFINCVDISISRTGSSPGPSPPPTPFPTLPPSPTPSPAGNGCCKWGGNCGDCGNDGSGWCHQSASNCQACTGWWDGNDRRPVCGWAVHRSILAPISAHHKHNGAFLK